MRLACLLNGQADTGGATMSDKVVDFLLNHVVNGGCGGSATLIPKSITANGRYVAADDDADGYSEVTVNVSGGSQTVEAAMIAGTLSGSYTNSEVTQVKARMFEDSSVSAIDFPNCTYVSDYAFKNARSLQRLNLPRLFSMGLAEAFTYDGYSLGDNQFLEINLPLVKRFTSGCFKYAKLKNIVLNSATSIDEYSFANCQYLESIDLAVKNARPTICHSAFNGDTLLSTLILRLTKNGSLWSLEDTTAFIGTPFDLGGGYIYVPSAKIDDYKAANNWSKYASRFRALEDYTIDGTTTGALDPNKI